MGSHCYNKKDFIQWDTTVFGVDTTVDVYYEIYFAEIPSTPRADADIRIERIEAFGAVFTGDLLPSAARDAVINEIRAAEALD